MKQIFTLFLFVMIGCSLHAQIVITEIHYNCSDWDDNEFLEFYNNSGADINMEGYYIGDGFDYVFPNVNFSADSYLVISGDSLTMAIEFGVTALQWDAGTLSSSGEDISLYTPDDVLVDYVDYEDNTDGWPVLADGWGFSLSLCDINADNEDPENWQVTTDIAGVGDGKRFNWFSPGQASTCNSGPIVSPCSYKFYTTENPVTDTIFAVIEITNTNGMPSSFSVSVNPASTVSSDEYMLLATTFEYAGTMDTFVQIEIVTTGNDEVAEDPEFLILDLETTANIDVLPYDQLEIRFDDDDHELNKAMVLAGVFETASGNEFGVELYALKDIPDLSIYGIGTANNGGGTDHVEIPLPAGSLSAGDRYFVSDSEHRFMNFFGIENQYTNPSIWVTGDDAIELFEHGSVIDTYGYIDVDGTDTSWEFDGGWATRLPDTGPDGTEFNEDNWFFSGIDALDGGTNEMSLSPYPLNFYTNTVGTNDINSLINISLAPNPVQDVLYVNFDVLNADIEVLDVVILDVAGHLVRTEKIQKGDVNLKIDTRNLSQGIYLLSLQTSEGLITERFVQK